MAVCPARKWRMMMTQEEEDKGQWGNCHRGGAVSIQTGVGPEAAHMRAPRCLPKGSAGLPASPGGSDSKPRVSGLESNPQGEAEAASEGTFFFFDKSFF